MKSVEELARELGNLVFRFDYQETSCGLSSVPVTLGELLEMNTLKRWAQENDMLESAFGLNDEGDR